MTSRLKLNLLFWAFYLLGVGEARLWQAHYTAAALVGIFVVSCAVMWFSRRFAR